MPRKHITVDQATAYSYELWMGRNTSIVHAITGDKEKISVVLPKRQVEKIAAEIEAGRQPVITISATLFTAVEPEAARSKVERS